MENQITKEILKKVRQVEVRTSRLVNDTMAGNYHSVFKGRGMNFDEVREYVPGDDIRAIDWNVTARTGIPHIKKFTEERELTIMLIIDISASGEFGSGAGSKREMMAELGSVLAFSARRNNDRVGLILFTDFVELYIPPKKGRSHILRVIREILFFQPQGTKTDLLVPLDFINRVAKRRCVTFLLSDYCLPGAFEETLSRLQPKLQITNRRHDLISMIISDPREHELPDVGWLTLEDAESGEQMELNTSDPAIRRGYAELAASRQKDLRRAIRSAGLDLLDLSTDQPYLPALFNFFKTRQRRQR
ncbi:MAG: DUF58 domain-containing protein [Proteobacteria bacterium]|nr:DUF58 domain-containing protein [Desulfocapsa sp.]MBU3946318.1 DUF58 domain-containing protein [Pseudomonadota bacterium]MCG2743002.1 DUF58 domain-containing protein [Desulfobacteraceae bacterium]MBU3983901.1 DUF58 domain-containing protein [Pseudomonadota bacterium]MBU4028205.1 DUF58 domain-containing protein [Pseudomonadota bacterium]